MARHYWILRRGVIQRLVNLCCDDSVALPKYIYQQTAARQCGIGSTITENKIVAEVKIYSKYNRVVVSKKCTLYYDDEKTLLVIDGESIDTALRIFEQVATSDGVIFFDVDDSTII